MFQVPTKCFLGCHISMLKNRPVQASQGLLLTLLKNQEYTGQPTSKSHNGKKKKVLLYSFNRLYITPQYRTPEQFSAFGTGTAHYGLFRKLYKPTSHPREDYFLLPLLGIVTFHTWGTSGCGKVRPPLSLLSPFPLSLPLGLCFLLCLLFQVHRP
jgi:hypothetical protein